jgi:hypothetical protein
VSAENADRADRCSVFPSPAGLPLLTVSMPPCVVAPPAPCSPRPARRELGCLLGWLVASEDPRGPRLVARASCCAAHATPSSSPAASAASASSASRFCRCCCTSLPAAIMCGCCKVRPEEGSGTSEEVEEGPNMSVGCAWASGATPADGPTIAGMKGCCGCCCGCMDNVRGAMGRLTLPGAVVAAVVAVAVAAAWSDVVGNTGTPMTTPGASGVLEAGAAGGVAWCVTAVAEAGAAGTAAGAGAMSSCVMGDVARASSSPSSSSSSSAASFCSRACSCCCGKPRPTRCCTQPPPPPPSVQEQGPMSPASTAASVTATPVSVSPHDVS